MFYVFFLSEHIQRACMAWTTYDPFPFSYYLLSTETWGFGACSAACWATRDFSLLSLALASNPSAAWRVILWLLEKRGREKSCFAGSHSLLGV
jgi:hypothetical protein